jgi:putative nucleotidyltransferase with HDIG domain
MSTTEVAAPRKGAAPLERSEIARRLGKCALLPSLSSINSVLRELLNAEQRYTTQISDVIRRDPSMTTRMLRLVNSVYYGLTSPVTSIEEAVFYLGIRQVRQIAMSTPIIEDLQKISLQHPFPWREFWQHCIATAILTREITGAIQPVQDEVEYVAGLLHDVGRIVMAAEFPNEFVAVCAKAEESQRDLRELEVEVLGMDHCELGAIYLKHHRLPEIIVEAAEFHAEPERASHHGQVVAAVQLANYMIRLNHIGNSGNPAPVTEEEWLHLSGWGILFPRRMEEEQALLRASLKHSLERLPHILDGII